MCVGGWVCVCVCVCACLGITAWNHAKAARTMQGPPYTVASVRRG